MNLRDPGQVGIRTAAVTSPGPMSRSSTPTSLFPVGPAQETKPLALTVTRVKAEIAVSTDAAKNRSPEVLKEAIAEAS